MEQYILSLIIGNIFPIENFLYQFFEFAHSRMLAKTLAFVKGIYLFSAILRAATKLSGNRPNEAILLQSPMHIGV